MLKHSKTIISILSFEDVEQAVGEILAASFGHTGHIQFTHHDRKKTGVYEAWLASAAQRVDWEELAQHYIRKTKEGAIETA